MKLPSKRPSLTDSPIFEKNPLNFTESKPAILRALGPAASERIVKIHTKTRREKVKGAK